MTINNLKRIIREHGVNANFDVLLPRGFWNIDRFDINGCDLLEYIDNIPKFISLLGRFSRWDIMSCAPVTFVSDYPDTIEFILNGDIIFITVDSSICIYVDDSYYGTGYGVDI